MSEECLEGKCGCAASMELVGEYTMDEGGVREELKILQIVYCPLHENAPQLYDALQVALDQNPEWQGWMCQAKHILGKARKKSQAVYEKLMEENA